LTQRNYKYILLTDVIATVYKPHKDEKIVGQSAESLIQTVIYTGFSNNWILMGYIKTSVPHIILASGIPCPPPPKILIKVTTKL
jgi:hypothetical protein